MLGTEAELESVTPSSQLQTTQSPSCFLTPCVQKKNYSTSRTRTTNTLNVVAHYLSATVIDLIELTVSNNIIIYSDNNTYSHA